MRSPYMRMWTFWWVEKQAWVPTLVWERPIFPTMSVGVSLFFGSYVWYLTQYLHCLCPFPFPPLCCLAGIDFKVKTIEVDGKKVKLQVWSVGTVAPSLCFCFFVELWWQISLSPLSLPSICCAERRMSCLSLSHQCHDSSFGAVRWVNSP